MSKLVKVLFVTVWGLLTTACTFEQQYNFNKKFGGTYQVSIDMTELYKSAGKDPGAEDLSDKMVFGASEDGEPSIIDRLNAIEGISNIKESINNDGVAIISLSFDFKKLENLNKALNVVSEGKDKDGNEKVAADFAYFRLDGKKLSVYENMADTEEMKGDEAMNGMLEKMKMKFSYQFTKPYKRFTCPFQTEASKDKKSLKITIPLSEYIKITESRILEVQF